jgi:hypothetical protein
MNEPSGGRVRPRPRLWAVAVGLSAGRRPMRTRSGCAPHPGRIQSFPAGLDTEAYARAKSHFEAALKAFQAAGKTLKDLFKFLVHNFGERSKSARSSTLGKRDWDLTLRC